MDSYSFELDVTKHLNSNHDLSQELVSKMGGDYPSRVKVRITPIFILGSKRLLGESQEFKTELQCLQDDLKSKLRDVISDLADHTDVNEILTKMLHDSSQRDELLKKSNSSKQIIEFLENPPVSATLRVDSSAKGYRSRTLYFDYDVEKLKSQLEEMIEKCLNTPDVSIEQGYKKFIYSLNDLILIQEQHLHALASRIDNKLKNPDYFSYNLEDLINDFIESFADRIKEIKYYRIDLGKDLSLQAHLRNTGEPSLHVMGESFEDFDLNECLLAIKTRLTYDFIEQLEINSDQLTINDYEIIDGSQANVSIQTRSLIDDDTFKRIERTATTESCALSHFHSILFNILPHSPEIGENEQVFRFSPDDFMIFIQVSKI